MKRTMRLRLSAALGVAALIAVACGGDDGEPISPGTEEESPDAGATGAAPEGDRNNVDGVLKVGTLVPQTGDLAALGPSQQLAYELAAQQINDAGGVLGQDLELVNGDSGTNEQVANNTVDQHLRDNVDAITGAASSRITLSVIDKITGAEVVQCSPSNTAAALSTHETDTPGFYFRTAPTDDLQGPALAQTIVGDGFSQVAILALNDEYGQGFAQALQQGLEDAGATIVANVAYDPAGTEFAADVQQIADANPEAVALIAFPDTGSKILREMISRGLGPQDIGIYTADGMQTADLGELVNPDDPSVLSGLKGTAPTSQGSQQFTQAFEEFAPPETAQIFSAHAFDCLNVIALAAEVAGTDDPTVFHNEMVGVTTEGEKCQDFASCKSLLDEGQDIDYDGATGIDMVDIGEPGAGTYEIWSFEVQNGEATIETLDTVTVGEGQGAQS